MRTASCFLRRRKSRRRSVRAEGSFKGGGDEGCEEGDSEREPSGEVLLRFVVESRPLGAGRLGDEGTE